MKLKQYGEKYFPAVEDAIERLQPQAAACSNLRQAIKYAVFSGGKRVRPILTLLGAELFGGQPNIFLAAAAACEFIHASSLIFDDLPCMDDASLRRGKTSLHAEFGEGIAILAAVSLLNASYGLVLNFTDSSLERRFAAVNEIVGCVGTAGMTGGQAVDLALAKNELTGGKSPLEIEKLKNLKTSALIRLSLCLGAILAGADEKSLGILRKFSLLLGEAYQISDDLSDLAEDEKIFAAGEKPVGATEANETKNRLDAMVCEAKTVLTENFPLAEARDCLSELCDYVANRRE